MSLISQRDREVAIEALECYRRVKSTLDDDEQSLMEINALINWIKLEQYKNDH